MTSRRCVMLRKFRNILPLSYLLTIVFVAGAQSQVVGNSNGDMFGPGAAGSAGTFQGENIETSSIGNRFANPAGMQLPNRLASFGEQQMSLPEYSPVLMDATAMGIGAVGSFPVSSRFFLRISIINLMPYMFGTGGNIYTNTMSGILAPVELGTRFPFVRSRLGSLNYTLYGETSAGLLLGWAAPTNGSLLGYYFADSRFGSGASAYMGIGNSVRLNRFIGLYLNGGLGYFDFFDSSFLPRTSYLVPSAAVGFTFNLTP